VHVVNPPAAVAELTRLYRGERFDDGRPRVPDGVVERMRPVTTEEAWGYLRRQGYEWQFEGGWQVTHPERILVGRAVTAQFVPRRPDLDDLVEETGRAEGRVGATNSWVIDTLQPGDVMVADVFGKVRDGPLVGDNLTTSLRARTRAGAVIDGTIRDFQGIAKMDEVVLFHRGLHPSARREITLVGVNLPLRIGQATVLPGDVVLGTPTGVIFVPAHLAEGVVAHSEDVRVRDEFGKLRLREGRYTPGQIDRQWTPEIEADFQDWLGSRR
jgi:regulator of RNase E activity RraA